MCFLCSLGLLNVSQPNVVLLWFSGNPLGGLAPWGETVCLQPLRWDADHVERSSPSQARTDHHTTWFELFPTLGLCLSEQRDLSAESIVPSRRDKHVKCTSVQCRLKLNVYFALWPATGKQPKDGRKPEPCKPILKVEYKTTRAG